MAKKSKLLLALDAEKGRDYAAEKKKKELKTGEKRKRQREEARQAQANEQDEEGEEEDRDQGQDQESEKAVSKKPNGILKSTKSISTDEANEDNDSEDEEQEEISQAEDNEDTKNTTIPQPPQPVDASASEAEQESDVPLSDLDDEDLEDTIPHQRLTINNGPALLASTKRVAITKPQMPFHHHNSLISTLPDPSSTITDPNDDLTRELEFYRIAKEATVTARSLLKKEKVPFTRPTDYFAEMVKTDEHMGKVKKKMYDEAAGKKAGEEAKKLRDAKKFGKQVQMAKEQERAREKRDTLDKIKELKRKRKGQTSEAVTEGEDLFQEISVQHDNKKDTESLRRRERRPGTSSDGPPNAKRQKRDSRFGFGGKKRFSKSGDAVSSADLSGFPSAARMKGRTGPGSRSGSGKKVTTKRLGKSRRAPGRA